MRAPADHPADLRIRAVHRPSRTDAREVAELIDRTTAHDHHRPIGEHALVELKEGTKAFPHAAFEARASGELAGYAHLSERETPYGWRLEAFTAPELRGRGIATALLSAVIEHTASHGGGRIHAWAYHPGPAHARLAERFGMRPIRTILRMERALPVPGRPAPGGVAFRSFRAQDADAWLELHNDAFAGHPDAGGWRPQDLAWHREEDWFDPAGLILAEDGQGLAGYCWIKLEGGTAWLYFLGVRARARGTGLGEALCSIGFDWATRSGAGRAALYVDDDNVPAVGLYRRLGFEVDHEDVCFEVEIPARPRSA